MRTSKHGTVQRPEAWELAEKISVFVFDSDGVFFPNLVTEGAAEGLLAIAKSLGMSDEEISHIGKPKTRSYYDGRGISMLRDIGIKVCFVTNEKGPDAAAITAVVRKFNNLTYSKSETNPTGWEPIALYTGHGGPKKVVAAEDFMQKCGASYKTCAFMCDDLVDWDLAQRVAFLAAPITAEDFIKCGAHFVSNRPAGEGAVRDVVNFILEARGIVPTTLIPN